MTPANHKAIRFKSDTRLRHKFMVAESFQHPAKLNIGVLQEIASRYEIQPGSWVLDPMAGCGTALILALQGINVICNELEQHFVEPMRASWEKMRQHPMLGYALGEVVILRGDARCLPLNSADAVVTSPPYEGGGHHGGAFDTWGGVQEAVGWKGGYTRPSVDAVISSPPYAEGLSGGGETKLTEHGQKPRRYTRPLDFIMTSPSYEATLQGSGADVARKRIAEGRYHGKRPDVWTSPGNIAGSPFGDGYSLDHANIGNMRGAQYWEAMSLTYAECHRVLRPGGIMVLILKGFTRNGQYVDLPAQTQEMCESLGFVHFDTWQRELWSLSFWRILQGTDKEETVVAHRQEMFYLDIQEVKRMKRISNGKLDDRLRYETVLAFRKPGGEGNGVDSVITSPPYEGSEVSAGNVGNRIRLETWGHGHSLAPDKGYTHQEEET